MGQHWSVREYEPGDESGVLELRKAVYPSRQSDRQQWTSRDHWLRWRQWVQQGNPVRPAKILLAEDDGKIVGHFSLIFMLLKVGNQVVRACQVTSRMTHPEYRRQGMALRLQGQLFDETEREGVHITIDFPNKAGHAVNMRTGYVFDVATTHIVFRPLNWGNAIRLRIGSRVLSSFGATVGSILYRVFYRPKGVPVVEGLTIRQISSFDERINEFWARVSSQYEIMVVRNKEYLNWRYAAVPDVDYSIYIAEKGGEICGYLVLRYMRREHTRLAAICDILTQSPQISRCLIWEAVEHCEREKVDVVYGHMIADRTLIKSFRNSGSIPFLRSRRFVAYSTSPHVSTEFLKDPKNWFVQIGDSDHV